MIIQQQQKQQRITTNNNNNLENATTAPSLFCFININQWREGGDRSARVFKKATPNSMSPTTKSIDY